MSNDSLPSQPEQKRRGWLFPALVASLAVNLIVVGGIGTAMLMHKPGFHKYKKGKRGWDGFVRKLPDDRRKILEKELRQLKAQVGPARANISSNWKAANKVLADENFSRAEFYSALEKTAGAYHEFKLTLYGAMADVAAKMTPEERAELSAWRQKRHERRQRRREKYRSKSGDK